MTLPTDRHFGCMKKCPMDCNKSCKRLAYPKLMACINRLIPAATILTERDAARVVKEARALLADLGEYIE